MNASVVGALTAVPVSPVMTLWTPLIIALVPILVMYAKRFVPDSMKSEIKVIYPILALVSAPVLDYAFTFFTSHQAGPYSLLYGFLAIGLREFVDQIKKVGAPAARTMCVMLTMIAFAGCATAGSGNSAATDPFAALKKFSTDDLTAAYASAKGSNDIIAMDCWSTLLEVQRIVGDQPAPKIVGLATLIQEKRNLLGAGGTSAATSVKRAINRGCAALFNDEAYTLGKMSGFPGTGLLP